MVDSTGVQGPAGWEVGMYLAGKDDFPVTGISWYEAQAYARYKGNILPPMFHWAKAAFLLMRLDLLLLQCFSKKVIFLNKVYRSRSRRWCLRDF